MKDKVTGRVDILRRIFERSANKLNGLPREVHRIFFARPLREELFLRLP